MARGALFLPSCLPHKKAAGISPGGSKLLFLFLAQ